MRAISLWQPWASLWCCGVKIHETRHWETAHRGWLLVHAAKKLISDCGEELDEIVITEFGPLWRSQLPRGAIIGRVHLVGCRPTDPHMHLADRDLVCGDFSANRFAWRADQFERLAEPIPYRGAQGFFNVPDDLVRSALGQPKGEG